MGATVMRKAIIGKRTAGATQRMIAQGRLGEDEMTMAPHPQRLRLRRPDDWHLHVRSGAMLRAVLPQTARQMGRAIIMPNLSEPVTSLERAAAYREEIIAALPPESRFRPLMTAYLTDDSDPVALVEGFASGLLSAVKLYPAHATTNAAHGVCDIDKVARVLDAMAEVGMPLLVHGEHLDAQTDIFDRETVFLERTLPRLRRHHPRLKIVLEHITTAEAVRTVREQGPSGLLAATVTAHHLMINRNHMFAGGIRPHFYCLPVAKRERHRLALRAAVTSGEPWFFLGTDSAPHALTAKESACGCAGIYTAASALELYAQVFEEEGALDRLEAFASLNGPAYYGLPVNEESIVLERSGLLIPDLVTVADGNAILPFLSGQRLEWRMLDMAENAQAAAS
jgi:dihydroorotase